MFAKPNLLIGGQPNPEISTVLLLEIPRPIRTAHNTTLTTDTLIRINQYNPILPLITRLVGTNLNTRRVLTVHAKPGNKPPADHGI